MRPQEKIHPSFQGGLWEASMITHSECTRSTAVPLTTKNWDTCDTPGSCSNIHHNNQLIYRSLWNGTLEKSAYHFSGTPDPQQWLSKSTAHDDSKKHVCFDTNINTTPIYLKFHELLKLTTCHFFSYSIPFYLKCWSWPTKNDFTTHEWISITTH